MIRKRLYRFLVVIACFMAVVFTTFNVYADEVGAGGTTNGYVWGTNVYTFYYVYDSEADAIKLHIETLMNVSEFGGPNYTYKGIDDHTPLFVNWPLLGHSLEDAIDDMCRIGGYNMSVSEVKSKLNALGYRDRGNGIWEWANGYMTYVVMSKIRPKEHTIAYDANGGTGAPGNQKKVEGETLYLSSKKPTRTGYTFKHWQCSAGSYYVPGERYYRDQDGGTVTMKAVWEDKTAPSCSSLTATPNYWSSGNGTVSFSFYDGGSGISTIQMQRYSYVTNKWDIIYDFDIWGNGVNLYGSYTEKSEGVFYYWLKVTDFAGNVTTVNSNAIYLDHSNPVINGLSNTVTSWTNRAPVISVSATDYLSGTGYSGSGVRLIEIKDEAGHVVASGSNSVSYTVQSQYEGVHKWYVTAKDNVGHTSSNSVTTMYDITSPGIDGTESNHVVNGVTYSGYCKDNIINQHIDDEIRRSVNGANNSSGIKSVILYRVNGNNREVIYSDSTKKTFSTSNMHNAFDMYYEIQSNEKAASYYEIIVTDFAGNKTVKKITSQYSLLSWFHTSINRSSYN